MPMQSLAKPATRPVEPPVQKPHSSMVAVPLHTPAQSLAFSGS
jgi:hypothetical protein